MDHHPAGATSPVTAALQARAAYGSAGRRERVIAMEQSGPNPAPLPPPAITGSSPPSPTPGDAVTLTGQNFGATPGVELPDAGPRRGQLGAPYDGAKLTITSWSDNSITFQMPPDSGSFPLTPGTATVTVTVGGQGSNTETITITS